MSHPALSPETPHTFDEAFDLSWTLTLTLKNRSIKTASGMCNYQGFMARR
jgi:hypothetical protein